MSDFFAMGGYAAYVWTAYGVTALVMVGLLVVSLRGLGNRRRTLAALERLNGPHRRARGGDSQPGGHKA